MRTCRGCNQGYPYSHTCVCDAIILQAAEEAQRKAAQAEAKESLVREAADHGLKGIKSLKKLGKAYQYVREQRCRDEGREMHIGALRGLVDMLRHALDQQQRQPIGFVAEKLALAAHTVEKMAAEQRKDLSASQGKILLQVSAAVERSGNRSIGRVKSLPEDIDQMTTNRNFLRSRHAQECRTAMRDLLLSGLELTQHLLDGAGIKTRSDFKRVVLANLDAREQRLSTAIADACGGIEAYNTQVAAGGVLCVMGAHVFPTGASSSDAVDDAILSAVSSFDEWSKAFLEHEHASKSDTAMDALQRELVASVDQVLGRTLRDNDNAAADEDEDEDEDSGVDSSLNSLNTALVSAGSALMLERQHQRKDALGFFPCTAITRAGRLLLAAWQAESAAVRTLMRVHDMLEQDLKVKDECMDGSGILSKKKDDLVKKLLNAHGKFKDAVTAQDTLTPLLNAGNESMSRAVSQALEMATVPTLGDLRCNTREKLKALTNITAELTGEIQHHFPEVIFYVGDGLPSELGALWQPATSLETSEEKELLPTASRHSVWRVCNGGKWSAVKEYKIGRARDLQTCLKEAAVVYRQRHPAIIQIEALFQDAGSNCFYLQMPWYEHGSLNLWVAGDQRPDWPQVRSVLLDALAGLMNLLPLFFLCSSRHDHQFRSSSLILQQLRHFVAHAQHHTLLLLHKCRNLISRVEHAFQPRVVLETRVVQQSVGERIFFVGGLIALHHILVRVCVQKHLVVVICAVVLHILVILTGMVVIVLPIVLLVFGIIIHHDPLGSS